VIATPSQTAPQNLTLHVAAPSGGPQNSVDIRIAQRAGEIQVSVHTPDPALQANLRQDLPTLVNSLDRAGFDAQTFLPRAATSGGALAMASASGGSSFDSGSSFGQGSTFGQGSGGQPEGSFSNGVGSGGAKDSGTQGQFSGNTQSSGQGFSGQSFTGQNSRDRQTMRWLDQIEE
jgi:hypothetical protein